MTLLEAYLFLFFDSIKATLIFVPNTEMVYNAMQIFTGYNKYYMICIASFGAVVGGGGNYVFGRALYFLKQKIKGYKDSKKFIYLSEYVDNRLFWFLLLSGVPLIGVLLTTFAGFFRVRFYKLVLIILISRFVYYIFLRKFS